MKTKAKKKKYITGAHGSGSARQKAKYRQQRADVYIEKPFSMKYLEASVRQLLEMRRLLRSKFSHTPLEPIAEIAPTQVDNAFLERMSRIIEVSIADSWWVNPMSEVCSLRAHFYFKLLSMYRQIPWIDEKVYEDKTTESTSDRKSVV